MKHITEAAFSFIMDRIQYVFDNDLTKEQWYFILSDYEDIFGEEGIQALAGFYLFAIRNLDQEGEPSECTRAIKVTWGHDIFGRKDKFLLPRSSGYLSVWQEEHNKYSHEIN